MDEKIVKIQEYVEHASHIVILQADNPDADSLGSALSLEHIFGDMGKEVTLYCAIEVPTYLRYMEGWDRVVNELPRSFDLSVIVDASTITLFEKLSSKRDAINRLNNTSCVILDHHGTVNNEIPFSSVTINDQEQSSTGELIYEIGKKCGWDLSVDTQTFLLSAILGDTQGLSNQMAKAHTYRTVAAMIENGVDRATLEDLRRQYGKMTESVFAYKAQLILRTEFYADNRIAIVTIPHQEIKQYSPLYNPAPLIQGDMLQVEGVTVAIVIKMYDDGHVTGAIRCNNQAPIAAKIAEYFGGGGHVFAGGFKTHAHDSRENIKQECIKIATEFLDKLDERSKDEATQYPV